MYNEVTLYHFFILMHNKYKKLNPFLEKIRQKLYKLKTA